MMKIKINKLIMCMMLIMLMTFHVGCANDNIKQTDDAELTPQPRLTAVPTATAKTDNYGSTPSVTVKQSVAYIFDGLEDNEVYAACEYENTSDCPAHITSLTYSLNISGTEVKVVADQPASMYCALYPGETFYNAIWYDKDCKSTDTISVNSVEITCEKTLDDKHSLTVSNTYIVQNYPGFATVSGDLTGSDIDVNFNEIYMGFYDSSDKLLGVWYFTDVSVLPMGSTRHFTTHLRSLPIEGLVDKTAKIDSIGFGFNTSN